MMREIRSTEKEKVERQERLRREFQKRFLASQEERKRTHYTPSPPRYDDVYFQGLAALKEEEEGSKNEWFIISLDTKKKCPFLDRNYCKEESLNDIVVKDKQCSGDLNDLPNFCPWREA